MYPCVTLGAWAAGEGSSGQVLSDRVHPKRGPLKRARAPSQPLGSKLLPDARSGSRARVLARSGTGFVCLGANRDSLGAYIELRPYSMAYCGVYLHNSGSFTAKCGYQPVLFVAYIDKCGA